MTLKLSEQDFENLWDSSMEWGGEWEIQWERFTPTVSYGWKRAYWFDSYASLILARTFLKENENDFQFASDEAGGWVLLTDYEREAIYV